MPATGTIEITILAPRDFTNPGPGLPPVELPLDQVVATPGLLTNGSYQVYSVVTYAYAGNDTLTGWAGPSNWAWFNRAADPAQYLTVLNLLDGGTGDDRLMSSLRPAGLSADLTALYFRADTLIGGAGNDTYILRDTNVTVVEGADNGLDTLIVYQSYITYSGNATIDLGDYGAVENVTIGGTGDLAVSGTSADNLFLGNAGENDLTGYAGNDTIKGMNGHDLIFGGDGGDQLWGGDGADAIRDDAGEDLLYGGAGDDSLTSNDGDDVASGGDGNDLIIMAGFTNTAYGGAGNDVIQSDLLVPGSLRAMGGDGNDSLDGSSGDDLLSSGAGDDVAHGHAGNDTIYGSDGADSLSGDGDADLITGSLGNDSISGGTEHDTLYGGGGADTITGDDGFDTLFGGTENDTLSGGAGTDVVSGGTGADSIMGDDDSDTLYGEGDNDIVAGGTANDIIYGGGGDDTLLGDDGGDLLYGDAGNDSLDGGLNGFNTVYGGDGSDTLTSSASASLFGDQGDDVISGSSGRYVLVGGAGNDTLNGGNGADTLDGRGDAADQADSMTGGAGNDVYWVDSVNDQVIEQTFNPQDRVWTEVINLDGNLYANIEELRLFGSANLNISSGTSGAFILIGNEGHNHLSGGVSSEGLFGFGGADTLEGGGGGPDGDQLSGGTGGDTFVFAPAPNGDPAGASQIRDFEATFDVIDLQAFGVLSQAATVLEGAMAQTFLIENLTATSARLQVFVDGDATAELTVDITLWTAGPVTVNDLILTLPPIA